jgi:predicted enzyme related to lactoylglutathione lyase
MSRSRSVIASTDGTLDVTGTGDRNRKETAMTSGLKTIVYPVKDPAKAKALFTGLLGAEPSVDQPYYVGFNVAGQEVGLDPNGHAQGLTGPVPYWHVEDIETSLKQLQEGGAEIRQAATDVGVGKLIARVADADGNAIGLIQEA